MPWLLEEMDNEIKLRRRLNIWGRYKGDIGSGIRRQCKISSKNNIIHLGVQWVQISNMISKTDQIRLNVEFTTYQDKVHKNLEE